MRLYRTVSARAFVLLLTLLPHGLDCRVINTFLGADGEYKDIDTGDSFSADEMALKFQGRSEDLANMLQKRWDETGHDAKERARSLRSLAEAFVGASRFEDGLDLARAALEAAPRRGWEYVLTVASAYRSLGQLDVALRYAREAKEIYDAGTIMKAGKSPPREELKMILTKLTITQDPTSHYSSLEISKLTDELNALRQATDDDGSLNDEQLMNEVIILEAQGKIAEAKEKAELLLKRSKSKSKNERTIAIHMYAKTIMREEPALAVPLFREALELRTELEGEHSERTANEMQHLAFSLHKMGNPKDALPYYKKSLKVIEKAVCSGNKGKCGHADVANAYRNLASCYLDLGGPLRAADYDKKADAVFAEKARIKARAK